MERVRVVGLWMWFALMLWLLCVGQAMAAYGGSKSPAPLTVRSPGGGEGHVWRADPGKYTGYANAGGGGVYKESTYRVSSLGYTITVGGREFATAAAVAAAVRPWVKIAGPLGLGFAVGGLLWDAVQGFYKVGGKTEYRWFGGPSCIADGAEDAMRCGCPAGEAKNFVYPQVWQGTGTCDVAPPAVDYGLGAVMQARCVGTLNWFGVSAYGQFPIPAVVCAGSPSGPNVAATDAEIDAAVTQGLQANPNAASNAMDHATPSGQDGLVGGPRELSGPASMPGGTTTTTGPGGNTVTNTTYNYTYNNPSTVTVTETTTTTDPEGNSTSTTSGPGAGSSGTSQAPMPECGSLSCESTQVQVKTNTDVMKGDIAVVKTESTAIRNELVAATAPTLPDQATVITAAKAADKAEGDEIKDTITYDTSRWTAFLWTPPAGTCTAPEAGVHGWSVKFDYCPFVDIARGVLGFLFALWGAYFAFQTLFRRD